MSRVLKRFMYVASDSLDCYGSMQINNRGTTMSETFRQPTPDVLFSHKALEAARQAGSIALDVDPVAMASLVTYIHTAAHRNPAGSLDNMTIVAMKPAKNPFANEKHLYQQK